MTTRHEIYEAWNGGLCIDIDQDNGEWVKYEDHAKEIDSLQAELRLYKMLAGEAR